MDELPDGPCQCEWMLHQGSGTMKLCGCGETHCRLYRDHVVHWQGQHWRLECAFEEAKKEIEKLH